MRSLSPWRTEDSGRGDRIALYLQNVPQYVLALIAAWKLGGVVVAINPMLTPREVAKLLTDSTPTVLVALDELHSPSFADVVDRSSVVECHHDQRAGLSVDGRRRILPADRVAIPEGAEDFCRAHRGNTTDAFPSRSPSTPTRSR